MERADLVGQAVCGWRRPWRATALVAAALTAAAGLAACGDIEEQSMCLAYDDFRQAAAAIEDVDPEAETAAGASELVADYLDSVRLLQETADGRYGTELATLESAVNDVLLTLDSGQDEADYSTWAPLVEESLEVAADAAVSVEDAIEPACPQPGSED